MQISALNKLASTTALYMGQFQEAEVYLSRSDRLAHEHEDVSGIAELSIIRCQMCAAQADFDHVVLYMNEMVEIGQKEGMQEHLAMGLDHISNSLALLTRFEESLQKADEALEAARAIGDRGIESSILCFSKPICLISRGELEEARRTAGQGLEIAKRIGSLTPQIDAHWLLSEIALWRGEYDLALAHGHQALEASLPLEEFMPFLVIGPLGTLGMIYLDLSEGFRDEIAHFHKKALAILENPAAVPGGGTVWADLGLCALVLDDLKVAEESFHKGLNYPTMFMLVERPRYLAGSALLALTRGEPDQALELAIEARSYAGERQMRHLYPFLDLILGRVYAARGENEQALDQFRISESEAQELDFRPLMWQAQIGASGALEMLGRKPEAEAIRLSARGVVHEIGSQIEDERLREAYLQSQSKKI
jgi:tetratricopeptide (TPR) repeat protein